MRILRALWPVVPTLLIVGALFRRPALADEQTASLPIPVTDAPLTPMPHALPQPVEAVEVLAALRYWTGRGAETLRPWADAIAEVARSRDEAIWIASQASVESRFVGYVLDYRCNEETGWTACDHGWAVGPWQMHDRKLVGAPPEAHAARAAQWMRARPQAWTTWRAARAQADAWLAGSQ